MISESLISAFIIGLAGSVHCLGMCGGIVTLAGISTSESRKTRQSLLALFFNAGRLTTYALFGLAAGLTGKALFSTQGGHGGGLSVAQIISGVLLILIGIYVTRVWNSFAWIEKAGFRLYRLVQPLTTRLIPVRSYPKAWLLGMTWGLMPCGMLYAAIAMAAVQSGAIQGLTYMLLFGLGTLPAMLSMTFFGTTINQFTRKPAVRIFLGLLLIGMGIAIFFMGHGGMDHSGHTGHGGHVDHSNHSGH